MLFPFTRQLDAMDCGPACLKMICDYHGRHISLQQLRERSHITREGVAMVGISSAAEALGFRTLGVKLSLGSVDDSPGLEDFPLPCIAYWEQRHFVVVYKINNRYVWIADPAHGRIKLSKAQFLTSWCGDDDQGIALGLEPAPDFYTEAGTSDAKGVWSGLIHYVKPYRRLIVQFMAGIIVGLVLQVMFPFLSQALIDVGVQHQNLSFITLVLIAQMVLFVSQTMVQFIQSWIILQIGKRINVSLISDFLMKSGILTVRI